MVRSLTLHFEVWRLEVCPQVLADILLRWHFHDWHLEVLHQFVELSYGSEALLSSRLVLARFRNMSDSIRQLIELPLVHVVFYEHFALW